MGYKQTPHNIALFMAALLNVHPRDVVYDPSAGGGMLCLAVMQVYGNPQGHPYGLVAHELVWKHWNESPVLAEADRELVRYSTANCLHDHETLANRVIMNSPFGATFEHVRHVFDKNLAGGGVLVSFMDRMALADASNSTTREFLRFLELDAEYSRIIPVTLMPSCNPHDCDKEASVLIAVKA